MMIGDLSYKKTYMNRRQSLFTNDFYDIEPNHFVADYYKNSLGNFNIGVHTYRNKEEISLSMPDMMQYFVQQEFTKRDVDIFIEYYQAFEFIKKIRKEKDGYCLNIVEVARAATVAVTKKESSS